MVKCTADGIVNNVPNRKVRTKMWTIGAQDVWRTTLAAEHYDSSIEEVCSKHAARRNFTRQA
jgi:hypothetical protein